MADVDVVETQFRTCPLCEATCGLAVEVRREARAVVRIRGDRDDVFSHGFICPKGSTLKQLHEDPDRLRAPLIKRDGEHVPATWDEAFAEIERLFAPVIAQNGRQATALYLGNPSAHNLSNILYGRAVIQGLGTPNVFSASTVDQMPKQVSSGLVFGTAISVPVPDLDRTDHLWIMGANPYASNGSLMTVPDVPGRLRAIRERGGTIVVFDPRRSQTAEQADEWVPIRPATDALFLLAVVHTLVAEDLVDLGAAADWVEGVGEVAVLAEGFSPDTVAETCGIPADDIRRLTRDLAAASKRGGAAVYGRIGTCTQEFGTLASWLVDVVNTLSGNLDRPGGVMFTTPGAGGPTTTGTPGIGRGMRLGSSSKRSRVRGLHAVLGELPTAVLAEEIDTPDEDGTRIRAMVTIAGNPVLSTQNAARLDAALASLDAMVSVDIYLNETTRHADVILPAPSVMARAHFDVLLYRLAIRNIANYTAPAFDLAEGERHEWDTLIRLGAVLGGTPAADVCGEAGEALVATLDADLARALLRSATKGSSTNGTSTQGLDNDDVMARLDEDGRTGPERLLEIMLRTGPYGDGFVGAEPASANAPEGGLSLAALEANPHGIDLGALVPRLPGVLRTPSGRIELAPPELIADVARLADALTSGRLDGMVLVGRRDLRSNNSWMHNLNVLVKGKERCTLHIHPSDAARLGLEDGKSARVASRVGMVELPVTVTDGIRQGVVSIPHGWGHDAPGARMGVAANRPGVNSNVLTDDQVIDPLSGNGVLNGIPVTVSPS